MKVEDLDAQTGTDYLWENILAPSEYYEGAHWTAPHEGRAGVEDITAERIARIDLHDWRGYEEYADQDFAALVELTDGTWATVMAWCDSSGFGCRNGVAWLVSSSRDEAIAQGLDREARRRLGVPLPGEESSESALAAAPDFPVASG